MENKWIKFVDEADYNLSEIMRDYHCSLEEALDTEYDILYTERKPEELTVPFKPEEVMDFDKEYSMEKIVSLIDRLKEMKSQNNIESIFIDKDSSVSIKF